MSLRANTNVEAFDAHRNLSHTQLQRSERMQELSSGLAIDSAADDDADLAMSEGMRSQITGTAQTPRNAIDGISLVQIPEGACDEMHSILQRVRELAVQAQNGTLSTADTFAIDREVGQLIAELTRLADNTQFDSLQALSSSFTLQVCANAATGDQIALSLTSVSSAAVSRIRDVEIAAETVNLTRLQILSQPGTAMLAQANSAPNDVLLLLRG